MKTRIFTARGELFGPGGPVDGLVESQDVEEWAAWPAVLKRIPVPAAASAAKGGNRPAGAAKILIHAG